ncbi:hypothetical protein IT397_02380 [Candidatus Nomurabacteria bacterium]|nr:hypothetical protein [Candidatus Nomurabacteria bacterium]
MNKQIIEKIINEACRILYRDNKNLIDEEAHERTIVPEILPYLREYFPDYEVWSEYNREGEVGNRKPKRDLDGNLIVPDIIVHEFGPTGRNLVAIEVKGYWNDEPRENDEEKLRGLHRKHGYEFLYRIELGPDNHQLVEVLPI